MWKGATKLKQVKLGLGWKFNDVAFQSSPTTVSQNYSGKWVREDGVYGPYTSEELRINYTSEMAGTWVWEKRPCAVWDETKRVLSFVQPSEEVIIDSYGNGTVHSISGGYYSGRIYNFDEIGTSCPWRTRSIRESASKIVFVDEIKPTSTYLWFNGFKNVTEIDVRKLNMSNVVNMRDMFRDCSKLTTLNANRFDTSKVTNMNFVLGGFNDSLKNLNLSN